MVNHDIAECVTSRHPDKMCDIISDAIVDACLEQDPYSRVAVETCGGHGELFLVGEITSKAEVNFEKTARDVYRELTGKDIHCATYIHQQSPEISAKVDGGGAGDQGVMVGYATWETEERMPTEMVMARKLLQPYWERDGKSQVCYRDGKLINLVLSVQGANQQELEAHAYGLVDNRDIDIYCNNIGDFNVGGFDADSGCTGRKIVVDAYGPRVPVGGGAFSGKDATKVDRSGAYMARWIAKHTLEMKGAQDVLVRLGYVIGGVEPLLVEVLVDGIDCSNEIDRSVCRPEAIIERFGLRQPIYKDLAMNGHFGRVHLPWEIPLV